MSEFDRIREAVPELRDWSDAQIMLDVQRVTGAPIQDIAKEFGTPINEPGFGSTVKRTFGQMGYGLGRAAEDFLPGMEDNALMRGSEDLMFRNPSGINSFDDVLAHPGLALQEGLGNAVTFMGPAIAARGLGAGLSAYGAARAAPMIGAAGRALGGLPGQTAIAGLPSYGGIRQTQDETGEGGIPQALLGAGAVGLIEQFGGPQRYLYGGLGRAAMGKTAMGTFGRELGRNVLQEAGEELVQNPIEQYAGGLDPTQAKQIEETLLGGVMGGIGGLIGAPGAAYAGLQHRALNQAGIEGILGETWDKQIVRTDGPQDLLNGPTERERLMQVFENMRAQQAQQEAAQAAQRPVDLGYFQHLRQTGMASDIDLASRPMRDFPTEQIVDWLQRAKQEQQANAALGITDYQTTRQMRHAEFELGVRSGQIPEPEIPGGVNLQPQASAQDQWFSQPGMIPAAPGAGGKYEQKIASLQRQAMPMRTRPQPAVVQQVAPKVGPTPKQRPVAAAPAPAKDVLPIISARAAFTAAGGSPQEWTKALKAAGAEKLAGKKGLNVVGIDLNAFRRALKDIAESTSPGVSPAAAFDAASQVLYKTNLYEQETQNEQGQGRAAAAVQEAAPRAAGVAQGAPDGGRGVQPAQGTGGAPGVSPAPQQQGPVRRPTKETSTRELNAWLSLAKGEANPDEETQALIKETQEELAARNAIGEMRRKEEAAKPKGKANATPKQKPVQGVQGKERPEVGLRQVAEGNAGGAQAAPAAQAVEAEKVVPKVRRVTKAEAAAKPVPTGPYVAETPQPTKQETTDEEVQGQETPEETAERIGKIRRLFNRAFGDKEAKTEQEKRNKQRNFEMLVSFLSGSKLKEIAADYDITESAVSHAIGRTVGASPKTIEKDATVVATRVAMAAKDLGYTEDNIKALFSPRRVHGESADKLGFTTSISEEEMIQAGLRPTGGMKGKAKQEEVAPVEADSRTDEELYNDVVVDTLENLSNDMPQEKREQIARNAAKRKVEERKKSQEEATKKDLAALEARKKQEAEEAAKKAAEPPADVTPKLSEEDEELGEDNWMSENDISRYIGDAPYVAWKDLPRDAKEVFLHLVRRIKVGQTRVGQAQESRMDNLQADILTSLAQGATKKIGGLFDKSLPDPTRYSETEAPPKKGMKRAGVRSVLMKLFIAPKRFDDVVTIVQTQKELPDDIVDDAAKSGVKVVRGAARGGRIWIVADNNANEAQLLGVFLHELGVHVGMKNFIGEANIQKLTEQIDKWAAKNDSSIESHLAQRAVAKAGKKENEKIAYFVQFAVEMGIDPTAVQKGNNEFVNWFRTLWAAAKIALRKIGLLNPDKLTAQNVVDLAMGAAELELRAGWHGTAASFRKFSHAFMGTGEGAQAYGWGTYIAQRGGIGHEYMVSDVKRKKNSNSGVLNEFMYDGKFIDDHSPVMKEALMAFANLFEHSASHWGNPYIRLTPDVVKENAKDILGPNTDPAVSKAFESLDVGKFFEARRAVLLDGKQLHQRDLERLFNEDILDVNGDGFFIKARDADHRIAAILRGGNRSPEMLRLVERVKNGTLSNLAHLLPAPPKGSLMRVDMAVADDEWLEWDKPMYEQSAKVWGAIKSKYNDWGPLSPEWLQEYLGMSEEEAIAEADKQTGEVFYRALAASYAPREMMQRDEYGRLTPTAQGYAFGKKEASEFLDSIGIKGTKFYDQPSRTGPYRSDNPTLSDVGLTRAAGDHFYNGIEIEIPKNARLKFARGELLVQVLADKDSDIRSFVPISEIITKKNHELLTDQQVLDTIYAVKQFKPAKTYNYVVFNDKNVVRVATKVGGKDNAIRFSSESGIAALYEKLKQLGKVFSKKKWPTVTVEELKRLGVTAQDMGALFRGAGIEETDIGSRPRADGFMLVTPASPRGKPMVPKEGTEFSSGDEARAKTARDIQENWPDQPINRKVESLVNALNDAGVETNLSGDGYDSGFVYVDLNVPLSEFKGTALPAGWKTSANMMTSMAAAHEGVNKFKHREVLRRTAEDYDKVRNGNYPQHIVVNTAYRLIGEYSTARAAGTPISPATQKLIDKALAENKFPVVARISRRDDGVVSAEEAADVVRAVVGETETSFSSGDEAVPIVERRIPEIAVTSRQVSRVAKTLGRKALLPLLFGHDLVNYIGDTLPAAKAYFQSMQDKINIRERIELKIKQIATDFTGFSPAEQREANEFIMDSTMQQKWGFQPEWLGAVVVDPDMEKRFKEFDPGMQKIIKDVFRTNEELFYALEDAVAASATKASLKFKRTKLDGPYASLMRFGDYAVIWKSDAYIEADGRGAKKEVEKMESDPAHYRVQFVSSALAAERTKAKMERELGGLADHGELDWFRREFEDRHTTEMPFQAVRRLQAAIEKGPVVGEKYSKEMQDRLTKMANQLYVTSLASMHARKSELHRRRIVGAEPDMMRSFVAHASAMARLVASVEVGDKMADSLQGMRTQAREGKLEERNKKMQVLNEILARHSALLNANDTPWQDSIMLMNSFYTLLTSPAYWMSNTTQPFVMTLPKLAGDHSMGRAWKALITAYKEVSDAIEFKKGRFDPTKVQNTVYKESEALDTLLMRGNIDITINQDIGDLSDGVYDQFNKMRWLTGNLRKIPHNIEMVNRVASAISAYRLEFVKQRQADKSEAEAHALAVEYANSIVQDTHGNYGAANAPRLLMQGNKALPVKMMGQFRKFQLIQAALLIKTFNQMFGKGLTPDQQRAARKTMLWLLSTYLTLGGLAGLPAGALIVAALGMLFGDDDDQDAEVVLTRAIGDRDMARLILHGVPAALGVDVSRRLGAGSVFSLMPFAETDPDAKKTFTNYVMAALGPAVGTMGRFADGLGLMLKGQYWKGLELMSPVGATNVSRGVRFATEGVTSRRGDLYMDPEEVGVLSSMFQMVGLPTTAITERQWKQRAVTAYTEHFHSEASRIKEAYTNGDDGQKAQARRDWKELQEARVKNGFTRQPLSELLKAPQEAKKRVAKFKEGVPTTKENARFFATM